eukprot:Awhi_evm3s3359
MSTGITFIENHESLIGELKLGDKSWNSNFVGVEHTLCIFAQRPRDKGPVITKKEADDFCQNSMSKWYKQTSFGQYNMICRYHELVFPETHAEFAKKKNNKWDRFKELYPVQYPDYENYCDNVLHIYHEAEGFRIASAIGGRPLYQINGKRWFDHNVNAHEGAHTLGLGHSNSYETKSGSEMGRGGDIKAYGDRYSVMGSSSSIPFRSDYIARAKYYFKWLQKSQNQHIRSATTVDISASDNFGVKPSGLVTATYDFGTGTHEYNNQAPADKKIQYMFEYRNQLKSEDFGERNGDDKGCVQVHLVQDIDQDGSPNFFYKRKTNTIQFCRRGDKDC